ncbi:hypothetical protein ACWCPQ_01065 [Nocardia sp. NPDC001965]
MDQSGTSGNRRGRKAAQTITRKVLPAVLAHALSKMVAAWMANLVEDDEAASPAHTVLTAIVKLWKILLGLGN